MPDITLYHNPRCSKSRQTLELLRSNNVEPNVVEYLNEPRSLPQLRDILKALDLPASAMIRKKEAEYNEAGLDDESSDEAILEAIVRFPKLMERPIAVKGSKAVIGRPPENILELLE
jgi:arsenate reductase